MREKYQRQGYMRKVLNIAFAEGDRLGVSVILETDAKKQVRQICASGHGTCRNAGSWHVWQAAQLSDMIQFHTRVCENGKKMEQPLENK